MLDEIVIQKKYDELKIAIDKGPDNPLEESLWQAQLGFFMGLKWVLNVKDDEGKT